MTVPTLTSAVAGNKVTATLFNTDVVTGIGDIVAGGVGSMGTSVLAAQNDVSTVVTLCTLSPTLVAGRKYRVTASIQGAQITNTGTLTTKLLIAGAEVTRLVGATGVSLAAGVVAWGSTAWIYVPGGGGAVTFSLTCQSTAAAFRVPASAAQLCVEDIGTN